MEWLKYYLILSILVCAAWTAPVNPEEAVRAADFWTAMELNSGYLSIRENERTERLTLIPRHRISYITATDMLTDRLPDLSRIRAYVVEYEPSGFCVVSADDRIEPILVFSADSRFCWFESAGNFLKDFLTKILAIRLQTAGPAVHSNWVYIRSRLNEDRSKAVFEPRSRDTYVLWNTALWGQLPYYNDTVATHNGNNTGIPTGLRRHGHGHQNEIPQLSRFRQRQSQLPGCLGLNAILACS